MKKYSSYKDSGVEWIGEIPSHWERKRVKNLTKEHRQGYYTNKPYDEIGFRVVRITDLNDDRTIDNSKSPFYLVNKDDEFRFKLNDGDFLFPRTGGVGRFGIFKSNIPSIYGSFLIRFRFSNELSHSFLKYYFDSNYYLNQILQEIHGGVNQNVHVENIKECGIIYPLNKKEQQQIVSFLDDKTQKIDSLIQLKEKKIDLLKEKRTSLINHVITKGLDPNVEMKDSGVEWIGEIPSHWKRKKLGYLVNLQGRIGFKGYKKTDFVDEGEGCRVIGGKHIDNNNKINLSNPDFLHWDKYYESPEIMVFKGDLIVSQRGTLGKVLMIEDDYGPLTINPSLVVVNQIKENTKFLWYSLQSDNIMKTIDILGSVTTIPMLSQQEISSFPILVPPLKEQQQIVEYLDEQTEEIDTLVKLEEHKIELLKEYRQSLISEVVTGKVRVCEEDYSLNLETQKV